MSDQERIKQLELELAELRGKISTLESILALRGQPYPVPMPYYPPPVYPWQPPFTYTPIGDLFAA
jgi:hypothetical protein